MARGNIAGVILFLLISSACGRVFLSCDPNKYDNEQKKKQASSSSSSAEFSDVEKSCDYQGYGKAIGTNGRPIVSAIVLIIMVIFCFVFLCGRLCNCMGGRRPFEGVCCVNPDKPKKYAKLEVWGIKGVMLLAVILGIIAIIVAGTGKAKIETAAKEPISAIKRVTGNVARIIRTIEAGVNKSLDAFTKANEKLGGGALEDITKAVKDNIGKLVDVRTTFEDISSDKKGGQFDDMNKQIEEVSKKISIAVVVLAAIPLFSVICVFIYAMLNAGDSTGGRCVLYIYTLGFFVMSWLLWLLIILLSITSLLITDVYEEMEGANKQHSLATLRQKYPLFYIARGTCDSVEIFKSMRNITDQMNKLENDASNYFCKQLQGNNLPVCNSGTGPSKGSFDCSKIPTNNPCLSAKSRHFRSMSVDAITSTDFNTLLIEDGNRLKSFAAAFVSKSSQSAAPVVDTAVWTREMTILQATPPSIPAEYANLTLNDIREVLKNISLPVDVATKIGCVPVANCTIDACALTCTDETIKNASVVASQLTTGASEIVSVARDIVLPLFQCSSIFHEVLYPTRESFRVFKVAIDTILAATVITAMCLMVGCVAIILGVKRFTKKSMKEVKIVQGKTVDEMKAMPN
jgi:hypothetical protein